MQETKLFPNMRRKFWQQDGARPHTAKVSKALIRQMFGNRWTDENSRGLAGDFPRFESH